MTSPTPVIGPITAMPFKIIRDVESPDGITTSKEGHLIVSSISVHAGQNTSILVSIFHQINAPTCTKEFFNF